MPVCKRRPAVDIEIADRQIFCRRRKIFPVFAGPEPSASELFQELEHGEHCRAWIVSGGIDDIPFCLECKNICILFFIKSEEYGFFSLKKDMKEIAANVAAKNAMELEDLSFSCGACGFSSPPVINTAFPMNEENLVFTDGNSGWTQR